MGYFEELYRVDLPEREFFGDAAAVQDANPAISFVPPTLEVSTGAVNRWESS